ncbi:hypothetical protein [Nostocoides japonicum]|uniref:hypothetical protein n=1 Tax=Nostocoides japonicum TaxID=99481 RepID=UPI000A5D5AC7|nr:hypothetical protein [Tetrasphaera japonica]
MAATRWWPAAAPEVAWAVGQCSGDLGILLALTPDASVWAVASRPVVIPDLLDGRRAALATATLLSATVWALRELDGSLPAELEEAVRPPALECPSHLAMPVGHRIVLAQRYALGAHEAISCILEDEWVCAMGPIGELTMGEVLRRR